MFQHSLMNFTFQSGTCNSTGNVCYPPLMHTNLHFPLKDLSTFELQLENKSPRSETRSRWISEIIAGHKSGCWPRLLVVGYLLPGSSVVPAGFKFFPWISTRLLTFSSQKLFIWEKNIFDVHSNKEFQRWLSVFTAQSFTSRWPGCKRCYI